MLKTSSDKSIYEMVIQKNIDQIEEGINAKTILGIIGYLYFENIPYSLFAYYLADFKTSFPFSIVGSVMDSLENYSFINSSGDSFEEEPYFGIDANVQKVIRNNNQNDLELAIKALLSYPPVTNYNPTCSESRIPFESMLSHCESVIAHANESSVISNLDKIELIQLTLIIVRYFLEKRRDLEKTNHYLALAEKWTESFSHPYKARTFFLRGMWWRKNRKFSEAMQSFKNAREFFKECNKLEEYLNLENNPTKCNQVYHLAISLEYQAQSCSDLANALEDQQDKSNMLKKAANLFDNAMSEYKNIYGDDHFDIARIIREQGVILLRQGRIFKCKDECEVLIRKARENVYETIERQKRVYSDRFYSHPSVAVSYFILGDICLYLNELYEAHEAYQESLKINRKVYGKENHPYVNKVKKAISIIEEKIRKTTN